jgi:peptide deformylase
MLVILPENHEFLTRPVPDFSGDTGILRSLAAEMIDVMERARAIGLAAPQVHRAVRIFVMFHPNNPPRVCINPRITATHGEPEPMVEGCLSFPALEVKVKRPPGIEVTYTDLDGKEISERLDGLEARCFQHELDHLNGITFDKRVSSLVWRAAKKKRHKAFRHSDK